MPAFAGISLFRWDINIRDSTVLGLVGAGGLGLKLQASLNTLAWNQLVILATVGPPFNELPPFHPSSE
jgi:phosphonate transport system permease protein